jgi:hypothetical protein
VAPYFKAIQTAKTEKKSSKITIKEEDLPSESSDEDASSSFNEKNSNSESNLSSSSNEQSGETIPPELKLLLQVKCFHTDEDED